MSEKKLVNIGCGETYHEDWINLDIRRKKHVKRFDIRNRLPFADNTVDVVYHSHVLEHLDKQFTLRLMQDCFRILKPGGVLRVVVPDLEDICREYLRNLDLCIIDQTDQKLSRYNWNKLELLDQLVRRKSGGEIIKFIRSGKADEKYVINRNGDEYIDLFNPSYYKNNKVHKLIKFFYDKIRKSPSRSGEAHRWMYDRLDLSILMKESGFTNPKVVDFKTSYIENWSEYGLDINSSQTGPRKPDSLFMEAKK